VSFTAVQTDNSDNLDFHITDKEINRAKVGGMKDPVMMRTGITDNRIKINRSNDFIINYLI